MVAGSKQVAIDKQISANGSSIALTSLMSGAKNIFLVLEVSEYVDGSYTLQLEHSPNGTDFEIVDTTAAQAADGFKYVRITDTMFETFRLTVSASGVTSGAKVKASLMYTANRL